MRAVRNLPLAAAVQQVGLPANLSVFTRSFTAEIYMYSVHCAFCAVCVFSICRLFALLSCLVEKML